MPTPPTKTPGTIAAAIILTLIFTWIFSAMFYRARDYVLLRSVDTFDRNLNLGIETSFFVVAYALAHPILGKLFHSLSLLLAHEFDALFSSDSEGAVDFVQRHALPIAGGWPVSAPILIPFLVIAVVYGRLFRSLFR